MARVYVIASPVPMPDIAMLTGGDGTFALGAPVPGVYEIGCSSDEHGSATVRVEVGLDQDVETEVRLPT